METMDFDVRKVGRKWAIFLDGKEDVRILRCNTREEAVRQLQRLVSRLHSLEYQEKFMGPDPTKKGMFRDHRCWKCDDGRLPCAEPNQGGCSYPRARND